MGAWALVGLVTLTGSLGRAAEHDGIPAPAATMPRPEKPVVVSGTTGRHFRKNWSPAVSPDLP